MPVVFMDGFDHYSTDTNEASYNGWTVENQFNTTRTTDSRFTTNSGRHIYCTTTGGWLEKRNLVPTPDITLGYAYYEYTFTTGVNLAFFYYSTDLLCTIGTDGVGHIIVNDASASLMATSTQVLVTDKWQYIEIICQAHATAGTLEVWVDGVRWINVQPADLENTGPDALIDGVRIYAGFDTQLDDVYITDDITSPPPLDAPRIITLYPEGQGNAIAWGNNYLNVQDEGGIAAATIDSTYIDSSTSGNKEGFTYPSLSSGTWTIKAVRPIVRAINIDATTPQINVISGNGAGGSTGAETNNINLTNQYETGDIIWPYYDAATTVWDQTKIDALEIEVEYV